MEGEIRMDNINKYRGCLIGGAIGDALGYSIEFDTIKEIKQKYGEKGICEYDLTDGLAVVSDDTQMTMFTANAIVNARLKNKSYIECIRESYISWLTTQESIYDCSKENDFWIMNNPSLYVRRAPGCTCLSAIVMGANGTIEKPINNSKGCGGIMRIAPIGLMKPNNKMNIDDIAYLASQSCALTHGHEMGFISCYFMAYLINLLAHNDNFTIKSAVETALESTFLKFKSTMHIIEFVNLINKAIDLSEISIDDLSAIEKLGEGWVTEETAAIAVYCCLKYPNDFEKAIIESVNHSGDSDSTGAVTGNILGSYIGIENIPDRFIDRLEHKNILYKLSQDLYSSDNKHFSK